MEIRFVHLFFVVFTSLVLVLGTSSVEAKKKQFKFCKLDHLFDCFFHSSNFLTLVANGTGLPKNMEEFEQFCFNAHDFFPVCAKTWLSRCGSPVHDALFETSWISFARGRALEACSGKKKPHLMTLMQHTPCIDSKVKLTKEYRETCIRSFLLNDEYRNSMMLASPPNLGTFSKSVCCVIKKWLGCITSMIDTRCGTEAASIFPNMLFYTGLDLYCHLEDVNLNDPNICPPGLFHAPTDWNEGRPPRGFQSTGIISYLFSKQCPNVGYGIDT